MLTRKTYLMTPKHRRYAAPCPQWERRDQEEELVSLRLELDTVSREVQAETKQLRDREEVIRTIRDEQQQVAYATTERTVYTRMRIRGVAFSERK